MAQMGPYMYDEANFMKKKFDNGRSFTVLISSAYNAGIIGPEINGLMVLDDDNREVIFDRFLQQSSGYHGASHKQLAAFNQIKDMDWASFSQMCRENPRYRRGSAPDLDAASATPDTPDLLNQAIASGTPPGRPGPSILTPEMQEMNTTETCSYKFPLSTREDIITFLANHESHSVDRRKRALSWNIKVHDAEMSGHCEGGEKVSKKHDKKWDAYTSERGDDVYHQACEAALSQYVENEFTTYPGDDQGDYNFSTAGRSGGHLILTEFKGMPCPDPSTYGSKQGSMIFEDKSYFVEWLKELPEDKLAALYKLVVTIDHDVAKPTDEVNIQISFLRQQKEEQWDDAKALRASKKAVKTTAMAPG